MWKDRTELRKQRERLLRLQDRIQSELCGVDLALKAAHTADKSTHWEWTAATENSGEPLRLHTQPSNSAKGARMLSLGLTPHYCCSKYTGQRLVYGLKQ